MTRLPVVGGDDGNWGQILNDFLEQAHQSDGALKPGSVTLSKLSSQVQAALSPTVGVTSQSSATYTLALTDAAGAVEVTQSNACIVIVPSQTTVAFPIGTIIEVVQMGSGQVSLSPAPGVSLLSADGLLRTRTQYSCLSVRKNGANSWVVAGDLA